MLIFLDPLEDFFSKSQVAYILVQHLQIDIWFYPHSGRLIWEFMHWCIKISQILNWGLGWKTSILPFKLSRTTIQTCSNPSFSSSTKWTILGGNPASWTAATPHAFGLHMPFPWYSRGPVRQAALLGLKTVVVLRNQEHLDSVFVWEFAR